jgi:hypothetical protein
MSIAPKTIDFFALYGIIGTKYGVTRRTLVNRLLKATYRNTYCFTTFEYRCSSDGHEGILRLNTSVSVCAICFDDRGTLVKHAD